MTHTYKNLNFLLLSALISLGTACSSGGGGDSSTSTGTTFSGNEAPAAIDASNAEAIGTASGEAVLKANSSSSVPTALSISTSTRIDEINSIVLSTVEISALPAGEEILGVCDSGTADIDGNVAQASGPTTFTIIYSNCTIASLGTSITFDGTVVLDHDDFGNLDAGLTITYNNFTVTDSSGTTTINLVIDCTSVFDCTFNSDFVGADGSTHRVTDFSISGSASGGFNGSATFLHGKFGSVSITITNIVYNGTCDPFPSGGDIAFSSSNGSSGTITFNSNCTFSGTWSNGSGSGSF